MAVLIGIFFGTSITPGDGRCATNSEKCFGIVLASWVTIILPRAAASSSTPGSPIFSGITPCGNSKSICGARRRRPATIF